MNVNFIKTDNKCDVTTPFCKKWLAWYSAKGFEIIFFKQNFICSILTLENKTCYIHTHDHAFPNQGFQDSKNLANG